MRYTSTLTSKNQTTLPKAVVAALAAKPSAKLCFDIEDDGRVVLTAKTATFAELAGTFPGKKPGRPATLEEMQEAIREGAVRRFQRSCK